MGTERIRTVKVTIEVDTSHDTYRKTLTLDGDETLEEFTARVTEAVESMAELE